MKNDISSEHTQSLTDNLSKLISAVEEIKHLTDKEMQRRNYLWIGFWGSASIKLYELKESWDHIIETIKFINNFEDWVKKYPIKE